MTMFLKTVFLLAITFQCCPMAVKSNTHKNIINCECEPTKPPMIDANFRGKFTTCCYFFFFFAVLPVFILVMNREKKG